MAARAARFSGLDGLTIDDSCCGTCLPPNPFAVSHEQVMVHRLEDALVAQPYEPAINCARWREAIYLVSCATDNRSVERRRSR